MVLVDHILLYFVSLDLDRVANFVRLGHFSLALEKNSKLIKN